MTIVLVEGNSDRVALEVFARRLGINLPTILVMGGAHAAARVAAGIREENPQQRILCMVDSGEQRALASVIDQVFVCECDLEDELIRALGIDATLALIKEQGELGSFAKLQRQPAQRDRSITDQLRRFLHGRSGNKARYAALFADVIQLDRTPAPIRNMLIAAKES